MKRKNILSIFLIILVSMASGCIGNNDDNNESEDETTITPVQTTLSPLTTSPPPTTLPSYQNIQWALYEFDEGDSFSYDVMWVGGDFILNGNFSLEVLSSTSNDYKIRYYGSYRGSISGTYNTTFDTPKEQFYDSFFQSVYSDNLMLAPFMFTIVSPWWSSYFADKNIEVGNYWTITVEGNTSTFSILGACSHAGISGNMGQYEFSGEGYVLTVETCINVDFPLPLATSYTTVGAEGITYSATLTQWDT